MGNTLFSDGSLQITITQLEETLDGADEAIISLNDFHVPVVIGSNEAFATYSLNHFLYEGGTNYTITIELEGEESIVNFQSPGIERVFIDSPVDNGNYMAGSPLTVQWSYDGDPTTDNIMFIADDEFEGENPDSTSWDYSELLFASNTSHTIPPNITETFNGILWISLDPGEDFYAFEGGCESYGSGITLVMAADWISLFPSGTGEEVAQIDLDIDASFLPADGISTANVYASVQNSEGSRVADGTPVEFSTTLGSISPITVYTSGGEAQAIITAPTTGGVSVITARSGSISESEDLTFEEIISLEITIGSGAMPAIYWTPSTVNVRALVMGQIGVAIPKWSIISLIGFPTPVTYGTLPDGATQIVPLLGSVEPLVTGNEYRLTLVAEGDDTTFVTFTR